MISTTRLTVPDFFSFSKISFDDRPPLSVTNVNKALEGKPVVSLVELQKGAIKAGPAIRNNGGGHCEAHSSCSFT